MSILPSLLKKRVIRKHRRSISQKSFIPEPLARSTRLKATQRKKPILSSIMDITMVERIVTAAPDTIPNTSRICL
ncbi:hypothetical protein D3C81_1681920 [compost metagenome]